MTICFTAIGGYGRVERGWGAEGDQGEGTLVSGDWSGTIGPLNPVFYHFRD